MLQLSRHLFTVVEGLYTCKSLRSLKTQNNCIDPLNLRNVCMEENLLSEFDNSLKRFSSIHVEPTSYFLVSSGSSIKDPTEEQIVSIEVPFSRFEWSRV